jgi:hypothetical protein
MLILKFGLSRSNPNGLYIVRSLFYADPEHGSWQVRFSNDDHFWAASPSDYVDVR